AHWPRMTATPRRASIRPRNSSVWRRGGTLALTSVDGRLAGELDSVVFRHVTIDFTDPDGAGRAASTRGRAARTRGSNHRSAHGSWKIFPSSRRSAVRSPPHTQPVSMHTASSVTFNPSADQ